MSQCQAESPSEGDRDQSRTSSVASSRKKEQTSSAAMAASKKDTVLDLNKYLDKAVRVKFQGGREVSGILKGFDQLVNLVLDESKEAVRDPNDPYRLTEETRDLGLCICRGTQVSLISPVDGMEEIANPFLPQDEM